jgi:hypothetical protein
MTKLSKIWKDRSITIATKARLVRALIFPIFLYGAETWTMKARDQQRADAFEMWCWRRMLRIPWTARQTNVSILRWIGVEKRLSAICAERILRFFGHIARRDHNSLEKTIMVGRVEGSRGRGRAPARWVDQVKAEVGMTVAEAIRGAQCREGWRDIIREVMNRRT